MRVFLALGLVVLGMIFPTPARASGPNTSYGILDRPTSSDDLAVRRLLQGEAQRRTDGLFLALSAVLGGTAPQLNFVPTGSPLTPTDLSTNLIDRPGAPIGQINISPFAVEALINNGSRFHSQGVNAIPHEMAHTRQTRDVLLSLLQSEGGAQAFADYVTPEAARRAGVPYRSGSYDGPYADYVKQVQAKGLDWLLGGQFGHAPVSFP